ncbi:NAD(P)/FAD-dependent oxidoreductase [Primorskyibacter aestuariivivens]|uniref:NAD(P)/FAD-dependent oxidoreductase n=1 Tax=Primorskyibacter aestuariivivens TaxID=1888912 RepID=UPI0023017052|nr:NAD(P)/FAD-dependent oxidoreductase [Primorskyibacter aestuariivivens]MDA7427623.1 NAD(P)/FAD-dependent oxidoreductase [Primorskyibacter aestuariivivens]
MTQRIAVIIGAGPAGLTAAYELIARTDIKPIIFEADSQVGGISKTVNYKGNRIDIGGHRFFSKSDRVMDWWADVLPLQGGTGQGESITVSYQNKHRDIAPGDADPEKVDEVMLVRNRVSRILYGRRFFDYPLKLKPETFRNLGFWRSLRIVGSYIRARLKPVKPEVTLTDFVTNRFGHELYATFFRDYTEKVWGVPCTEIPADWGAQRIKGVSIKSLIAHTLRKLKPGAGDVRQKDVETSLIERFLYPKHGPGQLWEVVARKVTEGGGELHFGSRVTGIQHDGTRLSAVTVETPAGIQEVTADYVFSSMPVQELIGGWQPSAPPAVTEIARNLPYRDFITVGVLLKRLTLDGGVSATELAEKVPDNWIYVQDSDVKVGRLQIFNNWSPYLVADPETIWLGMEYFVDEGDEYWSMEDGDLAAFGISELEKLGVARAADVIDHVVVRTHKAYPAYFGSYERFGEIQSYVSQFENLYCVGRNGMHRYNNQDHSILTAMVAVDGLAEGRDTREGMWYVNTEQEYHESR